MKELLQLYSLVRIEARTDGWLEKLEQPVEIPRGAIVLVLQHIDPEDALQRFVGLWDGILIEFHLFEAELKRLE